jgi:hypothetical protein
MPIRAPAPLSRLQAEAAAEISAAAESSVDLGEIFSAAKEVFGSSGGAEEIVRAISDQVGGAADDMFSSFPPEFAIGSVAIVGLVAIASIAGGDGGSANKRGSKTKVDLSIPYDAAARIAYNEWVESQEGVTASDDAFASFKTLFEEKAVAEVTAKQKARDMASFDPSKPKSKPRSTPAPKKAPVVTKAATASSTTRKPAKKKSKLFFAEDK